MIHYNMFPDFQAGYWIVLVLGMVLYNRDISKNLLSEAFKIDETESIVLILVVIYGYDQVFPSVVLPCTSFITFLTNLVRRDIECEADSFAASLGYGKYLKTALLKIDRANRVPFDFSWLYEVFKQDHPSGMIRIQRISG